MSQKPRVTALIVAAGSGSRAGGDMPKQYRHVRGKPVIAHAIEHLINHALIDTVSVVIADGQQESFAKATEGYSVGDPVIGGSTRQESVLHGLEMLCTNEAPDTVLIHDAARPFLPSAVIDKLLAACESSVGAIPAIPVTDSLAGRDGTSVSREDFVHTQTPQAFAFKAILDAHRSWKSDRPATDDAQVARAAGHTVAFVEGDAALKKLTFAEDFEDAMASTVRTGLGYDVHAFAEGDHIWLGGIRIEHGKTLAGHSDADVALHALTDAILGALGDGDIGDHFPPSDPQWEGAASHRFLEHAKELVEKDGQDIYHVDVTVICEAPKVGPHRAAIRARIAEILAIPVKSVSVKATTTEGLGFTGRGEGIAAQAIATLGPAMRSVS